MNQFTLRTAISSEELKQADILLQTIYQLLFKFNYPGLRKELNCNYPSTVLSLLDFQDIIVSTLSISHKSTNNTFPSEDIFGFTLPQFLKNSKRVVEIGKLAKKFKRGTVPVGSENNHNELKSLLQGVMVYAKENELEYWTATLHPVFAQILNEIDFPYTVIHEGFLEITDKNRNLLEFTGHYGTSKLIYAYYSMEESIKAVSKWDLSNITKMEFNYENYA